MRRASLLACIAAVLTAVVSGQNFAGSKAPTIIYQQPEIIPVYRGRPSTVQLNFRIPSGFHINSNQPKQEYLKKTELRMDPPTDIAIEKLAYPEGEDRSFPFDPNEKLNVYTGDITIGVTVRPLKTVMPAKYAVHGILNYQACDNAACYPPKHMPISFEVKVEKAPSEHHKRIPPQSPHTHS